MVLVFKARRGASGAGGAPLRERGQRMNSAPPAVEAPDRDRGQTDRPEVVVDLFEGDVFADEREREKQRRALPGHLAAARRTST